MCPATKKSFPPPPKSSAKPKSGPRVKATPQPPEPVAPAPAARPVPAPLGALRSHGPHPDANFADPSDVPVDELLRRYTLAGDGDVIGAFLGEVYEVCEMIRALIESNSIANDDYVALASVNQLHSLMMRSRIVGEIHRRNGEVEARHG